jgi:uncharacterized hydrophobic protein (TIGR00341 family)
MRKIEIIIPKDKIAETTETLNKLFYEYNIIEGQTEALLIILTESGESENVIDDLKQIGVTTAYGRINISPILGFIPRTYKRIRRKNKIKTLSFEELFQIIEPQTYSNLLYIIFCIISTIVATLGLIYNYVAVIIGGMVISPLLGPIIGTSFGTITNDRKMLQRSLFTEFIGIIIAVCIGLMLGFSNPEIPEGSVMRAFATPTLADFGLGIASGLAAALCIVSGLATFLVGIAVATSILPPAVNMGLLLTMGQPDFAFGSLIILLINLLCINFVCTITFFVAGVKSPVHSKRMEKIAARTFRKHLIIVFFAILILVLVIILAII